MNLRKKLLVLAWALFGASLLLPSMRSEGFFGFLPKYEFGFICVAGSFLGLVGLPLNVVALLFGKRLLPELVYAAAFGLCNLLMLLSPAVLKLKSESGFVHKAPFKALFVLAALSVCLPWFLSPAFRADLMAGYYVWCLSFVLLAIAMHVRAAAPQS